MARTTVVELVDDIDGGSADETVRFGLDGSAYEIDLSSANAERLRAELAPYVGHARKAGRATAGRPARGGGPARTSSDRERSAEIRTWAARQGIEVSSRGRIPAQVVAAFEAKDPSLVKSADQPVPQATFQPASDS
jgi:hypothetical protein